MKFIFCSILFFLCFSVSFSQNKYDRFSVELSGGTSKVFYPITDGFYSVLSPIVNVSTRFMLNHMFGVKAEFNTNFFYFWNNFDLSNTNLVSRTNYYRTSLIGVTNLGNLLNFKRKTPRIGLLLETGGGFSIVHSKRTLKHTEWKSDYSEILINLAIGLSPQFKISDRVALNFNVLMISHFFQTFAFDMNSSAKKQELDGIIFNFSTGITYYLGQKIHFDWNRNF